MQEFDIELGDRDIYTLKNQTFNVVNNGSADLTVDSIKLSSSNITMLYTKTPFLIVQNKSYTLSGYLKITDFGESNDDYIECNVSQTNEHGNIQKDKYKYNLKYTGIIQNQYSEIFEIDNITYIKDMLILLIESNDDISTDTYPNIIIHSIDNQNVFVFPKIYRISTNKVAYIYQDSNMNNKIIDNNVRFNVIHSKKSFDVYKISYRSI